MLSLIIASRREPFLKKTIQDVLLHAVGNIEVLVSMDGYDDPDKVNDDRVRYIFLPESGKHQKRQAVVLAAESARGEYLACLDAHCHVCDGFDEVLTRDHEPDWVQVPRCYPFDPLKWVIHTKKRIPADYSYLMWRHLAENHLCIQRKWDERTLEREDIKIDDQMDIGGGMWFMTTDWFRRMGFFRDSRYGGFGVEGEEIAWGTLLAGGKVKVNKNTYYAHWNKHVHPRPDIFLLNSEELTPVLEERSHYWIYEQQDFFVNLVSRFMPIPNWPDNWERIIYD